MAATLSSYNPTSFVARNRGHLPLSNQPPKPPPFLHRCHLEHRHTTKILSPPCPRRAPPCFYIFTSRHCQETHGSIFIVVVVFRRASPLFILCLLIKFPLTLKQGSRRLGLGPLCFFIILAPK